MSLISVWIARATTGLLLASVSVVTLVTLVTLAPLVATPSFVALLSRSSSSSGDTPIDSAFDAPIGSPPAHGRLPLPLPLPDARGAPELGPSDALEPEDEEARSEAPGQLGQTRQAVVLHERPLASSMVLGRVDEGELVSILQVAGDWALVYYGGRDTLVAGWAKKSEIAIR